MAAGKQRLLHDALALRIMQEEVRPCGRVMCTLDVKYHFNFICGGLLAAAATPEEYGSLCRLSPIFLSLKTAGEVFPSAFDQADKAQRIWRRNFVYRGFPYVRKDIKFKSSFKCLSGSSRWSPVFLFPGTDTVAAKFSPRLLDFQVQPFPVEHLVALCFWLQSIDGIVCKRHFG